MRLLEFYKQVGFLYFQMFLFDKYGVMQVIFKNTHFRFFCNPLLFEMQSYCIAIRKAV